ncbi:MAG: hypothetical protein EXX96DRAFT_587471 [Benjaminiella poitrasii]|nr:MAG: hypothetical protein EXX96DRAFT_587471 [Benjaminiella poitrasii]
MTEKNKGLIRTQIAPNRNGAIRKATPNRPVITATKASLARAKAVNAQLTGQSAKSAVKRKRPMKESNTLVNSYKTTAAGLKERPSWDIRGKMKDMAELYEMNAQRLEELNKHKREQEILRDEKESQEKEALQRAAALRTQIHEMERQHSITIENMQAQQRIENQRLEDDKLNSSRRLTTIEIEVGDAKNKLDIEVKRLNRIKEQNASLRDSMKSIKFKYDNVNQEHKKLEEEIAELDGLLFTKKKEAQKEEIEIRKIDAKIDELKYRLEEGNKVHERIVGKIKELELKKKSSKKGGIAKKETTTTAAN